jgi:hypothetical protein
MAEEIKSGKQPWQKPGLIVLVRLHPEEFVLVGCKWGPLHLGTSGPNNLNLGCGTTFRSGCDASCHDGFPSS